MNLTKESVSSGRISRGYEVKWGREGGKVEGIHIGLHENKKNHFFREEVEVVCVVSLKGMREVMHGRLKGCEK